VASDGGAGELGSEVDRVLAAATTVGETTPIILIDGRSGSGKTELGVAVAAMLGAELVRLDDLYPGWDGLEAGSELVHRDVLGAHRWRRWDWATGAPAEEWTIDPGRPIVVEGSGSLSRANRLLATLGVWVELDEPKRRARAMERDGAMYEPHWDDWAAQEQRFFDRERPDQLANIRIDGAKILDPRD
jgi:cytidylate kinase